MAKKETKEAKIVLERTYNVPLRKEYRKSPRHKRSKKAVTALREFLAKHMKSDNVKIGKYVNDFIWRHGIKNPPHHVKVEVTKDSEGKVIGELVGAPKPKPVEKKKETKDDALSKAKEMLAGKETKEEPKKGLEASVDDKQEKAKKIEKEEIKELKQEHPKQQAPKQTAIPKNVEQHPNAPMKK